MKKTKKSKQLITNKGKPLINPKMKQTKAKSLINKDMTIAEVVGKYPETVPVLMKSGMHCLGCPMSMMETLEQGLSAHGIKADKIIDELNKIAKRKK